MGKRGRKPVVEPDDILSALKSQSFDIVKNDQIIGKKEHVWNDIAAKLCNQITPTSLYIFIHQNRKEVLRDYLMWRGYDDSLIIKLTQKVIVSNDVCDDLADDIILDISEPLCKKFKSSSLLDFQIEIKKNDWLLCEPLPETTRLKPGWPHLINSYIWQTAKLPCCFNFKNSIVRKTSYPYVTVNGYCRECGAKITAECEMINVDMSITFTVKTKNSYGIAYEKKRRLTGQALRDMILLLQHQRPQSVRRALVRQNMKFGDPEPAHIPTSKALLKAKQKGEYERLKINPNLSFIESLDGLKEHEDMGKYIREIGFNKFFITYYSNEQIRVYYDVQRYTGAPLTIDSTGSQIKKIKRISGTSSDVLLTVGVTHVEHNILPALQFISEKNDGNFYVWAFNEWLKAGAILPAEVTTDVCRALQTSACVVFNRCELEEYCDTAVMILKKKPVSRDLRCFLRTYIAHFINIVRLLDCFKLYKPTIGVFYKKCIGLLATCKSIDNFENILEAILVVASSKSYTPECQSKHLDLANLIKTHDFDDYYWDNRNLGTEEMQEEFMLQEVNTLSTMSTKNKVKNPNRCIVRFIHQIAGRASTKSMSVTAGENFDVENSFCLDALVAPLLNLCYEFPLWSNVLQNHFNSLNDRAVSARSECYFSHRKKAQRSPLRADKYVIDHCNEIESDVIIAKATLDRTKAKGKVKPKPLQPENMDHLKYSAIWRDNGNVVVEDDTIIDDEDHLMTTDLAEKDDEYCQQYDEEMRTNTDEKEPQTTNDQGFTKKGGKYVTNDPLFDIEAQTPTLRHRKAHIINGNKKKSVTLFKKRYILCNTCAFDACSELCICDKQ